MFLYFLALKLIGKFIRMIKYTHAVEQFHEAFGLDYKDQPTIAIPQEIVNLRFNLMAEENQEYLEAAQAGDMIEVADALGDMLYILCGTLITHGMQHKIDAVFEAIQESNMSKLGANGKPIYREDGKVLKGPAYFKPDIKGALNM